MGGISGLISGAGNLASSVGNFVGSPLGQGLLGLGQAGLGYLGQQEQADLARELAAQAQFQPYNVAGPLGNVTVEGQQINISPTQQQAALQQQPPRRHRRPRPGTWPPTRRFGARPRPRFDEHFPAGTRAATAARATVHRAGDRHSWRSTGPTAAARRSRRRGAGHGSRASRAGAEPAFRHGSGQSAGRRRTPSTEPRGGADEPGGRSRSRTTGRGRSRRTEPYGDSAAPQAVPRPSTSLLLSALLPSERRRDRQKSARPKPLWSGCTARDAWARRGASALLGS